MDNNTSLFLNHLIYEIYNVEDFENLKIHILESLKTIIPFECGSICMAAESGSRHLLGASLTVPTRYHEIEERYFLVEDHDISRWQMQMDKSTVLRVTDLMEDDRWVQMPLYRTCYSPFGLYYGVDMTILLNGRFLGILTLYRQKIQGDFSDEEMFLLQLLSDHLNARFFQETTRQLRKPDDNLNKKLIERYGFTAREADIAARVIKGYTNEEIADELCISVNTLKKHLQHIYRKANITSRVKLAVLQP